MDGSAAARRTASTCGPSRAGGSTRPRSRSTGSIPTIRCASRRPRAMRSARSSARCVVPCASSSARARSSSVTTRPSTSASSMRRSRAPGSGAIPSTRSRASTRRRSRASPTGRPCCREPRRQRASNGIRGKRTRPPTTPSARRTCSASSATSSSRSTRRRAAHRRRCLAGGAAEPAARAGAGVSRGQPTAPASCSSVLSSPERYISVTMSQPPTSSPFT